MRINGARFQYDEKADLVRFKVTPVEIAEQIETFTIEFNRIRDESAVINLVWDHTVVPIEAGNRIDGQAGAADRGRHGVAQKKNRMGFIFRPPPFITTTIRISTRRWTG